MDQMNDNEFLVACRKIENEGLICTPLWKSNLYEEAAVWERYIRETLILWGENIICRESLPALLRNHYMRTSKEEIRNLQDEVARLKLELESRNESTG